MGTISQREYGGRRRALLEKMAPGAIAIVPGAVLRRRNGDVDYPFRQDSDFWYLTGFGEPGALLVLRRGCGGGGSDQAVLFCQEANERDTLYNGERLGPQCAAQALGMDAAYAASALEERMPALIGDANAVYCSLDDDIGFQGRLCRWLAAARANRLHPAGEIRNLQALLHELRLFKSAAEIRLLRRAAEITVEGHLQALRRCRSGLMEADLEAELHYAFLRTGARALAYPAIVASGANACVLHYTANNSPLQQGHLVLIDAGCEYEHYAADLTRTFPVDGRFTPAQQILYEIVLEAQQQAIAACQPGAHFDAADEAALRVMQEGLAQLGLPSAAGPASPRPAFCPHKSSHWLGLDVHDCGGDRPKGPLRNLAPGMVLTVEPGLYIPAGAMDVPVEWRGVGVRIEDDVLITADGPDVLTDGAPKDVAGIERVMAGG